MDLLSYKGEVRVLVDEEPEGASFLVGSVSLIQKETEDEILEKIKTTAAKDGADTMVLLTSEPMYTESGNLFWKALAFKTQ